jgi:type I restriction-modification system DNA methylase subunit
MPSDFVKDVIDAFSKIKEEIDEKRGEQDFRHSLADHILKNVLEWGRKKGVGHFELREREDIRLFDDSNRCVALIETKNPKIDLKDEHRAELKNHLDDYKGVAQYGALTNGHVFQLFEYTSDGELNELVTIDIDAFVKNGAGALSKAERHKIHMLRRLKKDRFVGAADPEYFKKTSQTIKVDDPQKFDIFIDELRTLLNDLTETMDRFFKFYLGASPDHYGGKFLREEAFLRWKGASTGDVEELEEKFCRETAYVILNRILFTRILEDKRIVNRMISGEEFAKSLTMFGEGAYETVLKQAYKNVEKFYEHFYEFGIFDWWRLPEEKRGMLSEEEKKVQKEIEDEFNSVIIRDILKSLNQFDFRKVGRDILGDVYQEYLSPVERKRLGEFYTPVEVVRYILDAVGYTPENRIEDKLLLDPACGSGTFLVEASKRLVERYAEKLRNPLLPDNAKIVIEGITSNINGLDINPFACHIAEMNMLFNIIDYLHAAHTKYKDYRLPRFNICCTDSLMQPDVETAQITEYITNGRIRSYTDETKRAMDIKKMRFDFVVGNPPYVRVQMLSKEVNERLRKSYETVLGKFDIYIPFIERGINWLTDEGNMGYINPNLFFNRDYGKSLRKFILEKCRIKQIIDFGDSGVFKDVTNYPCILILQRHKNVEKEKFKCAVIVNPKESILPEINNKFRQGEYYQNEYYTIFEMEQNALSEELWRLAPVHVLKVLEKIDNNSNNKLGNIRETIYEGFISGANQIYFVDLNTNKSTSLEKELLKKVPKGRDVRKWKIIWNNRYVIYPHDEKGAPLSENDMKNKYRGIYQYLNSHKNVLKNRKYYGETPEEMFGVWFALVHPKPKFIFEQPKIVTPNLSTENNFTFDEEGYFLDHDCYGIILKNKERNNYLFVLGLLNSVMLEFYLKQISPFASGKYYRYMTGYLERLPIKLPKTKEEQKLAEKISSSVKQVLQVNKQFNELEEKIAKFPESYFSGEKLVKTAEECKLSKDKYDTKSLTLEPTKKAGKELYKLALTKEDYILFSSRAVAECALEQLKRKVKVRIEEIHELKVPSEKDASRIMGEFSGDKKRVEEIKKEVEKLEHEINELVYELYGITEEEKKIIVESLK